MNQLKRIPPQAVEIEESILGTMLVDRQSPTIVFGMLSEDDFYTPYNLIIFKCIFSLYENNNPIDLLTLENELKKNGQLNEGQSTFLSDLTKLAAPGSIEYYCQILIEKKIKRNLIKEANEILEKCYDNSSDTYDVLDQAQEAVFNVNSNQDGTTHDIHDTIMNVVESISERMKTQKSIGIKSGLNIDYVTNGFQNGKFYVIAARPSMGKTALALEIMRRMAREKQDTAILSLETSPESLGFRLLSQVSGVESEKLLNASLNDDELQRMLNGAAELSQYGIYIDDTLTMTDSQLRAKARVLKQKYNIKALFIDYLQLLLSKGNNREQEIAKVSRMCKVVAKELDIPVIALAQLSRAVEQRGGDKRPQLSDLRDSGQIEQDADVVMFLYRPEYYGINTTESGDSTARMCEVIISKNKDGAIGTKLLEFDKKRLKFNNWTTESKLLNDDLAPF